MTLVRQLEFALFDFRLHLEWGTGGISSVQELLYQVRDQVAVIKPPAFNRFQASFSHIFAGGYAAGYYSYKWAEVLAADAYEAFEEAGIFDADTARRFRTEILEVGGSCDIIMSGMSVTRMRQVKIAFTAPYFRTGQMALVQVKRAPRLFPKGFEGITAHVKDLRIGVVKPVGSTVR